MRSRFLIAILLIVVAIMGFFLIKHHTVERLSLFPIQDYDQNISDWIDSTNPDYEKLLLTETQQKMLLEEFYRHNFSTDSDALSPWNPAYIDQIYAKNTPDDLLTVEQEKIAQYGNGKDKPKNEIGFGANFHPYTEQWSGNITKNINLDQFHGQHYDASHRAIAIDNVNARILPTEEPFFYDPHRAGEGYPFDNLQASVLWAGTSIYILGETLDHAWDMVLTPEFYIAWVKSTAIARVDDTFINQWQQKAKINLAGVSRNDVPVVDDENKIYHFSSHLGMIFPVEKIDGKQINILIPVSDANHHAFIRHAYLSNQDVVIIPLSATMHQFSDMINRTIGRSYGWGNMYFYNDCSAELRNLFTLFGVWLPRHSTEQVNEDRVPGRAVDLMNNKPEERIQYLTTNGHPFMTIGYIGGHVFLYIGNYANPKDKSRVVPLTYQNIWGLRPRQISSENDTRVVIGGSVLFPLLKAYPADPNLASPAEKKYFKIMYLNDLPKDMAQFRPLEFSKIDLRILLAP